MFIYKNHRKSVSTALFLKAGYAAVKAFFYWSVREESWV